MPIMAPTTRRLLTKVLSRCTCEDLSSGVICIDSSKVSLSTCRSPSSTMSLISSSTAFLLSMATDLVHLCSTLKKNWEQSALSLTDLRSSAMSRRHSASRRGFSSNRTLWMRDTARLASSKTRSSAACSFLEAQSRSARPSSISLHVWSRRLTTMCPWLSSWNDSGSQNFRIALIFAFFAPKSRRALKTG